MNAIGRYGQRVRAAVARYVYFEPVALAPGAHMPGLDGVRGLAIAMVLAFHTIHFDARSPVSAVIMRLSRSGWSGVDLFFVLSGFLITGILLDSKGRTHYYRSFYGRRAIRIFPLYYFFLLLFFVVLPTLLTALEFEGRYPNVAGLRRASEHQLWFWSYLSNFWIGANGHIGSRLGHIWSLAIEEQFYLLWPIPVALLRRRGLALLCVLLIVLASVLRVYLNLDGRGHVAYYATICRLDTLAIGALGAMAVRSELLRVPIVRAARFVMPLLGLALIGVAANYSLRHLSFWVQTVGSPALMVCFAALVLTAATAPSDSAVGRALGIAPLRILGRYSYSIYLFHAPIHGAVRAYLPKLPGQTNWPEPIAVLVLSLGAAVITWHLIERPVLRLRRHFELGT